MNRRHRWLSSASLLVLGSVWSGHALAQNGAASAVTPQGKVEEVVVTAQKRTERLRDLTVTATVLSSKSIAQNNVTDISDLNKLVPAVNINGSFNGRVPLGIRGISSDSNEGAVGIASGVGVEVDGIPIPSDSFSANAIEDITNVEVLEGPQATLGGRTATSGLINYITHKPTTVWTGGLTTTLTNDNERNFVGDISGPLTDGVLMSLVAWDHHTQFPLVNVNTGKHSNDEDYGARGKLQFRLAPDLDATITGRYSQDRSTGSNFAYSYVYPGASLLSGLNPGFPFWSQAALFPPNVHIGEYNTNYATPVTNEFQQLYDGDVNLNLTYHLGENTLTSTTAYQRENRTGTQDLFVVDDYFVTLLGEATHNPFLTFNNMQTEYVDTSQLSEEVKFATPVDQPFNYIAGVFYSDTDVKLYQERLFPFALDNAHVEPDTKTVAPYFHANFKVLANTTLSGGVRLNHDIISYKTDQIAYAPFVPPAYPPGPILSSGNNSSNTVVGDISIKQQFSPGAQAYFTYTRGYAPAAYNTAIALAPGETQQPVAAESINSFELGTKGNYLDDTLRINADLFDTIYDHYQVSTFVNVPGQAAGILDLTAAGQAESRGAEIDAVWKPAADTTVSFNGALIRARYNKFDNGPCYWGGSLATIPAGADCTQSTTGGGLVANLSGKTLPNSPKVKFTVGLEQDIPLNAVPFDLETGGTLTYQSSAQMLPDQNPESIAPSRALLNLHLTGTSHNGKYSLTFFINNVTNRHYNVDYEDFWAPPWGSNAIVVQPARDTNRYFGFRLTARY